MSNKMLAKRLLATGMSVAMSATLFMTNGIATYAAEEIINEEEPVEKEPTASDIVDEEVDTLYQNVVEVENEDGSVSRTITTVQGNQKNYYTDAETEEPEEELFLLPLNPGEEDDRSDYHRTTKEEIDASETPQHCDFVEVNEFKIVGEEHTYLEGEDGEKATYTTCSGEEKPIELSEYFTAEDLEEAEENPVMVVKDYYHRGYREITACEENCIFYGKFEDGVFVPLEEGDEGATPFLQSGDYYIPTNVVYTTMIKDKEGNSEVAFIDKETYDEAWKALNGEESIYTVETVYTHKSQGRGGQDITTTGAELKERESAETAELDGSWAITDAIDYYIDVTDITVAPEATHLKKSKDVVYDKYIVTGEANENGEVPVDYFFSDGKHRYKIEGVISADKVPEGAGTGYVDDCNIRARVKKEADVYSVTVNNSKNYTLSYVTVKDPASGEVIFEGTPGALKNLKANNVTEVEDKIKVQDGWNTYYLDVDDYTLIREHEEKLFVSENFYYTVQDKTATNEVEFSMGGKDYALTVDFWQNSRIGITGVRVLPNEDGTEADIIFEYDYSKYSDYDESNPESTYTMHVTADDFSSLGEARVSIDFLPVYFNTFMPQWIRPVAPRDNVFVLAEDAVRVERRAIAAPGLLALNDANAAILADILEEVNEGLYYGPYDYEASDIMGNPLTRNSVKLIQREPKWVKGAEPAPVPGPGPSTPDEPTGTEETPFFFTTLAAAPAGQVLGEQRPLAADGAAVLGASRARGTADETTAPIARVLVMAAVAATALFLTRKKEENN